MRAYRCYRDPEAFTLDGLGRSKKRKREHHNDHLKWIRTLPCLATGSRVRVEAAHVRYADARFAKRGVGIGEKPDDKWTVPLCAEAHREGHDAQHASNERAWWEARGIDPVSVASALWSCSGDDEAGEQVIQIARRNAQLSSQHHEYIRRLHA